MNVCDGNPCQNGGTCSTSQFNTQVCFTRHIEKCLFYLNNIKLKPQKIFECSCVDGFSGEFCEFKTDQDHLLLFDKINPLVFNGNGKLIDENAVNEDGVDFRGSCSTMLNCEAVIIGGLGDPGQVLSNIIFIG